jgi:FkbM family methyltransferase
MQTIERMEEIKRNITLLDLILSPLAYYEQKLNALLTKEEVIKNWPEIILFRLGLKKKIVIELKDGKKVKIENPTEYSNFWDSFLKSESAFTLLLKDVKLDRIKRRIQFKYKNHLIQLYLSNDINIAGSCREQFVKEIYKWLDVKGKIVVDIGAYIGDSAIYFAINGAKHVYAFEPYPFSYKIALKNIKLNNLEKKVTVLNEAIGGRGGIIYVDEDYKNATRDDLKEFKKGKKIKVVTLEEVVKRFKLKNAVLKMDCEGCEYFSILNTPNETLRNFEQIMLEYHYGYLNLKKKLKEAGFEVKTSLPKFVFNERASNPNQVLGYLYAERK